MPRYKAIVEYDGTPFMGWQRQPCHPSVQQHIEESIKKFSGRFSLTHAAGRTDTGVHAKGQVIHFDLEKEWPSFKVRDAVNYYLKPLPICLMHVERVADDFHARFSAIARSYRYVILNRYAPLALDQHRAWRVPQPLDVETMGKAAHSLVGTRDFSTFRGADCQAASPLKTLDVFEVTQEDAYIIFFIKARSFLHHQVRNMVGTLKLVGLGNWTLQDFMNATEACDRRCGGAMAPAAGLYFLKAYY